MHSWNRILTNTESAAIEITRQPLRPLGVVGNAAAQTDMDSRKARQRVPEYRQPEVIADLVIMMREVIVEYPWRIDRRI